jgi:hypothetical protein
MVAVSLSVPLTTAGQDAAKRAGDQDHDFGNKVLYVVTKSTDASAGYGTGYFENVKVVRLADRAFLVGTIPAYGEGETTKAAAGKRVWTPISDILQMTEFATVAEAEQYFETARKERDKDGR